jgi:integrase
MLTEIAIAKLPTPAKRKSHPAGGVPGLNLLHQPSGAKSWALQYRWRGIPRKLTIGTYPTIGLAEARRLARAALGEVAKGDDPAALKRSSQVAARADARADDDCLSAVAAAFVEKHAKRKAGSLWAGETERLLRVEILPTLGAKRIAAVKRSEIHDLLDRIVDRGSPVTANRALSVIRKLYNWALERELVAASPVDRLKKPTVEISRDRVLADDELRAVWLALESIEWPIGPWGKLLLLTAARRMEVAAMRWPEIDLAAKTWTIPRERSKNGVSHEVPLSAKAVDIIEALPHVASKVELVFTNDGRAPIGGFARVKERIDAAIVKVNNGEPIAPWRFHDLRRTSASGMAGIGIPPHIVEAVLGHRSGTIKGVAAVYNRYSYATEKRAALETWARRIEAIVSGEGEGKVVSFMRK